MRSLAEVTDAALGTARGLSGSLALKKLVNMLRNMQRSYPTAQVLRTSRGVFGVSLDAQRSINVFVNGSWSDQDLRDCFSLFATWCVVDREGLTPSTRLPGPSLTDYAQSVSLHGRRTFRGRT